MASVPRKAGGVCCHLAGAGCSHSGERLRTESKQHGLLGWGPIGSPGGWDRPPASESPGLYREEGPCVQHTSTQAFSSRDALLQDCAYVRAGFKTCSSERQRADHDSTNLQSSRAVTSEGLRCDLNVDNPESGSHTYSTHWALAQKNKGGKMSQ